MRRRPFIGEALVLGELFVQLPAIHPKDGAPHFAPGCGTRLYLC